MKLESPVTHQPQPVSITWETKGSCLATLRRHFLESKQGTKPPCWGLCPQMIPASQGTLSFSHQPPQHLLPHPIAPLTPCLAAPRLPVQEGWIKLQEATRTFLTLLFEPSTLSRPGSFLKSAKGSGLEKAPGNEAPVPAQTNPLPFPPRSF